MIPRIISRTMEKIAFKFCPILTLEEAPSDSDLVGYLSEKSGVILRDRTGEDLMKYFIVSWDAFLELKRLDKVRGAK